MKKFSLLCSVIFVILIATLNSCTETPQAKQAPIPVKPDYQLINIALNPASPKTVTPGKKVTVLTLDIWSKDQKTYKVYDLLTTWTHMPPNSFGKCYIASTDGKKLSAESGYRPNNGNLVHLTHFFGPMNAEYPGDKYKFVLAKPKKTSINLVCDVLPGTKLQTDYTVDGINLYEYRNDDPSMPLLQAEILIN